MRRGLRKQQRSKQIRRVKKQRRKPSGQKRWLSKLLKPQDYRIHKRDEPKVPYMKLADLIQHKTVQPEKSSQVVVT